jgi:catechol 2,3-dioxygenase-like lactoylglutathione lyase family enzyme
VARDPLMFERVTIRASEREASERFYDTVLGALGIGRTAAEEAFTAWEDFVVAPASAGRPATRRLHIGFVAPSREHADAFWQAGIDAGHRDDGAPGPRPVYGPDYYGAFLLDPDGNSAEAVHHGSLRAGGIVDHLWIRVADVAASRRFYATIGPHAGFHIRTDLPERVQLKGETGSFSVVAGDELTEHAHLTFGADGDGAVEAFRRAATAAGYREADGDGARVLDPDGHVVELVRRDRA